jgi:UDP-N-acetylmuramoyl-tripeptide--D-alanyl-D-alanine ligase
MEPVTLRDLLEAVNGRLLTEGADLDAAVTCVDTDSRSITPGSLFIPLVGERFDGHAYLNPALESGAAGCLTARERERYLPGKFYIKVDDTLRALWDLARYYRRRFDIPVIGVTGSVGKTTTKDMIAAVLSTKYRVLKTDGNFNNTVGLPLTVLRLSREDQVCVLEMGMSKAGEIDALSSIAEPDIAVITNIGDAHIENLGSREAILAAKCEMLAHVRKPGLVILNGDDPLLTGLRVTCPLPLAFCGMGADLDYRASDLEGDGKSRLRCRIRTPKQEGEVEIPALGNHMIYPTLTAVAVGERLGLTWEELVQGILRFAPTKMRMNIVARGDGVTILDDAYNANPQSMRAAIEVLSASPARYKIAVLGDMLELGPFAQALHESVGECVGKGDVDCLIAVGELARHLRAGADKSGVPLSYYCPTKEEAKQVLKAVLQPNSTVLVKASRGMAMEELVDYLKEITPEGQ